jgi:hypothetical protein
LFEHDLFGKPASTFPDHALRIGAAVRRTATAARPRGRSLRTVHSRCTPSWTPC